MRDRLNKPKVFLSHSSLDKGFIERLARDLRKCQIDPWLDTEEIRDGRPWLKVIFEDGIPACDAIIIYLTENSLDSKMVEKEMDASFVEQLSEGGIVTLPYVSHSELRGRLRPDVRALQCREWNDANYDSVLPTVVAEIWRSYVERTVGAAVLQETNRRLELELELRRAQERFDAGVFKASEEREFSYLRQKLDRDIEVALSLYRHEKGKGGRKVGEEVYKANLLSLLISYVNGGSHGFRKSSIELLFHEKLSTDSISPNRPEGVNADYFGGIKENISLELQTYGLASFKEAGAFGMSDPYCEFTDKMYRFKYWLEYNDVVPTPSFSFKRLTEGSIQQDGLEKEDRDLSYVVEIDEEVSFYDRRSKWRTTEEGVLAARQEVKKLFDELERLVKRSNEKLTNIRVDFTRGDDNHCLISSRQHSLSLRWQCVDNDKVENSQLSVVGYESTSEADADSEPTEPRTTYQTEYTIDMQRDSAIAWRGKSEREPLTSEALAARFLSHLLSSVRNRADRKD